MADLAGRTYRWSPWMLALIPLIVVLAVTAGLGREVYDAVTRDYPGVMTSMLSAGLRVIVQFASIMCVGSMFYAAFIRPRKGAGRLLLDPRGDLRSVRTSAAVWFVAAVVLILVDGADSNGYPVLKALAPGALGYLVQASYLPGAWIVASLVAATIFIGASLSRSWVAVVGMLILGMAAMLGPVVVTQVLVGPDHDFGGDASIFGVPATAILFGATAIHLSRLCRGMVPSQRASRRFRISVVTAWFVGAAALILVAWFETPGTPFYATVTGRLFAVELGLWAVLGINLFQLHGLDRFKGQELRSRLIRFGVVGVASMSAFIAVNVIMTRIPPPQYFVPVSVMEIFFGYDVIPEPTLAVLALDWRMNTFFAVVALVGVALYLVGVLRLRRRQDRWPVGRTISWILGWVVLVITTSSGLGKYSGAAFSIHMILHMSLNMVIPVLLVMGGPVTLALLATKPAKKDEAAGAHEWLMAFLRWPLFKHLYNPLWVFIEFISSYYVLYFTPLFEQAMRYHWAHQLFNIHLLIVGYLFYSLVIGVDLPPRPLPHIGKLGLVLAAMPFHAFFGIAVMSSGSIIAENFYQYIDRPWLADLHADQYLGGGIAWAAGEIPLLMVVLALFYQWSRQDRRDSVRVDRHLDAGLDGSFDAYNDMLSKLASRQITQPSARETT